MNQLNITAVPKAPQDTPVQDAIMCAVLAAGLYLMVCTTGCGVTAGAFTAGSTSFLQEANRARIALDDSTPSVIAARKEVQ